MQILQNISLKAYNTFGLDVPAEYLVEIRDTNELKEILSDKKLPVTKHILGGGSNILLTKPIEGLTILNRTRGIVKEKEDSEHVWLSVNSGEAWHDFVMFAIDNGWAGVENLALIPGTVGAAPMQNIGAYGVEAKETIDSVTCWHVAGNKFITLKNEECNFGYRDSIFKHELKGEVFITSVCFRLNKKATRNTSYGAIAQQLESMQITDPGIREIANAVIAIRSSKLPDPKKIGNAGSFFKNPTIPRTQFEQLKGEFPDIPSYPVGDDMVKVPAGWLIEQCGWKGHRERHTGVHEKQALVLVNYGGANGTEVWDLSQRVLDSVREKYNIELEREVQVW